MIRRTGFRNKLTRPKSELERAMKYFRENLKSDRILSINSKSLKRPKSAIKFNSPKNILSETKDSKESSKNPAFAYETPSELSSFINSLSFLCDLRFELELNYNAARIDQIDSDSIGDYYSLKNMIEKLSTSHLDSLKDLSKILRGLIRKLKDPDDKALIELFWRATIKAFENLMLKHHKDVSSSDKLHQIEIKQTASKYNEENKNLSYKIKALETQVEMLKNEMKLTSRQKKKLYEEIINKEISDTKHEIPDLKPDSVNNEILKTDLESFKTVQYADKHIQTRSSLLKEDSFHPWYALATKENYYKSSRQVIDFCKLVMKKWKGEPFWHKFLTEIIKRYPDKLKVETEISSYLNTCTHSSFVKDEQSLFYYKMLDFSNRKPYNDLYKLLNCVNKEFSRIETHGLASLDNTIILIKTIFKKSKKFATELLDNLNFEPEKNSELPPFVKRYKHERIHRILCRVSLVLCDKISHFKTLIERVLLNTGNLSGAQISCILVKEFDLWLSQNEKEILSDYLGSIISIEKSVKKLAVLKYFDIAKTVKISRFELLNKIYDKWSHIEDNILHKLAPMKDSTSLKHLEEFLAKKRYNRSTDTIEILFRDLLLGKEFKTLCEDYQILYEEFPKYKNKSL